MADLFGVTAPLTMRFPDGHKVLMVEVYPHPEGLIYFEPFWHLAYPPEPKQLIGEIRGDGPWKIGDCVITVLGCHGTDPELAHIFNEWQWFIQSGTPGYPSHEVIENLVDQIAKTHPWRVATIRP